MINVDLTPCVFCLRRSVLSVVLATCVLGISACSDSDNPTNAVPAVDPNDVVPEASGDTIADSLLNRTDYQTLLRFIEESDLTEALQGDNAGMRWTLFAPADAAFEMAGLETLTAEQSAALVGNHLYSGQLNVADIMPGVLQMTVGSVEVVEDQDGMVTVGGSTIVAGDRVMSNGVIHFVSSVLEPL